MTSRGTETHAGERRLRFRLRWLFVLTTIVAYICGLGHYVGGLELVRHFLAAVFPLLVFLVLFLLPLVLIEILIAMFDFVFGLSTRSPIAGRRRFD